MSFGYGGNIVLVLTILCLVSADTDTPNLDTTKNDVNICSDSKYLTQCEKNYSFKVSEISLIPKTKSDVDILCSALKKLIACFTFYLTICDAESSEFLSDEYIRGLKKLTRLLCDDKRFQEGYLNNTSCYSKIEQGYNDCTKTYEDAVERYNSTDEKSVNLRCCFRYKYFQCVDSKTIVKCDSAATANFLRLVKDMLDVTDSFKNCFPEKEFPKYCKQLNRAFSNSLYTPLFFFISIEFYLFNIF